ncbi:MAG: hypothetical protein LC663_06100, partial [Actinobacteria bacterium]|nr:hypothetical protein [Actinomycetota bacterium]
MILRYRAVCLLALACLAIAPGAARASNVIAQRNCPIPATNADPDRVELATAGTGSYELIVDESPGEASHAVVGNFVLNKGDGSMPVTLQTAGLAPASIDFTLEPGHTYTIDWQAAFDFGIHPCVSA